MEGRVVGGVKGEIIEEEEEEEEEETGKYLGSSAFQGFPVYAREDVAYECGVVLDVLLLELGVAEMEREGEGGGFAGFDGAGEEVDG